MKPYSEFHNCKGAPHDIAYWCKECACKNGRFHHSKRMKEQPEIYREKSRQAYISRKFGFSLEEYKERLAQQGSACAICEVKLLTSGPLTHLDHSHKTGKIRAFLCTNCNRGLGHFQDSPELLSRAKVYLETHTINVDDGRGGTRL
jgi:hypothetical protein